MKRTTQGVCCCNCCMYYREQDIDSQFAEIGIIWIKGGGTEMPAAASVSNSGLIQRASV